MITKKSVPIYLCGHDLLFGRTISEGNDIEEQDCIPVGCVPPAC